MDLAEWCRPSITDINVKLVIIFYSASNNIGRKVKYCTLELFALRLVRQDLQLQEVNDFGLIEETGKQAIKKS